MVTRAYSIPADDLLSAFLLTRDEGEADRLLAALLAEAAPVIKGTLRRRSNPSAGNFATSADAGAEDLQGDVQLDLLRRLRALRQSAQSGAISSFEAYVAGVTRNAYNDLLRRNFPRRHSLRNKLRYLLQRSANYEFWKTQDGAWLCATAARARRPRLVGSPGGDDDLATAREYIARNPHLAGADLPVLIDAVLNQMRAPVKFDDLVSFVAEATGVEDRPAQSFDDDSHLPPDARQLDADFERRRSLQQLWSEIRELPVRQRTALLLNLRDREGRDVITLIPQTGIAGIAEIASLLDVEIDRFLDLWERLPLDDAQIAELLGATQRQVIKLRRAARERLDRRMRAREKSKPHRNIAD